MLSFLGRRRRRRKAEARQEESKSAEDAQKEKGQAEHVAPADPQFRFGRTAQQQEPVIFSGKFCFSKDREFPNGRTRWKCTHVSGSCPANIYTVENDVVMLYDKHNHE
jgi:hypothetical protein